MNNLDVTYIVLRFPYLTETFVAEEIKEAEDQGIRVQICSLLSPKKDLVHPVSAQLMSQVHYAPGMFAPSLWWAQLYFLFKAPGLYFKLLWALLTEPAPELSFVLMRLVVFLKGIWLAKKLEKSPPKLIHTHFAWLPAAAGMVVSQLLDRPFTITAHAYDIYSRENDLLRLTTTMADHVVTISEYNKQAILEMNDGLSASKIKVIHCGIDLTNFQAGGQKPADNELKIISVGSLVEKKGHQYLIQACKELDDQGVDFQCVIVGGGRLEQSLQTLIEDLNLTDKVTLAGTQTQIWVRDRLSQSDLFALACVVDKDRDGIPVAMMESLAVETPVVSTSITGIPELIRHEETGLLVQERNAKDFAAAIMRLVEDRDLGQTLAGNGRMLVEEEYDISKNVTRLVQLFEQVIEARGK